MTQSAVETPTQESNLEKLLKRCRGEVLEAAKAYRSDKNPKWVPTIVLGVLERFVEADKKALFALPEAQKNALKLQADLGLDSLVMVEVVMTLEEVLSQSIPDSELRGLYTVEDTLAYVEAKTTGKPLPVPPERLLNEMLPLLLENNTPAVTNVVLRPGKIEAAYDPVTAVSAQNAYQELAVIYLAKQNDGFSAKSVKAFNFDKAFDAPTELCEIILEALDGKRFKAYSRQNGQTQARGELAVVL